MQKQILKEKIGKDISKRGWVYLTKIESDDMYRKDAVEEIQQQMSKEMGALTYNVGYVLSHEKPSIFRRIRWAIGKLLTKLKLK